MRPLHKKICPKCGVPYLWGKDSVLDDDNTSLLKTFPSRGIFYEIDEIHNLLRGLEESIELSLSQLFFTVHKRAIARYFNGTLEGISGTIARKIASKAIYWQMTQVTPNFGVGRIAVESYKKGKFLKVRTWNAWNEMLLAADIAGAWTSVEKIGCRVSSKRSNDHITYLVEALDSPEEEYVGRLIPITGVLMGPPDHPRCPACGGPESFRIFRWDRESGIIQERDNGLRVVHQTIGCVDSLMNELEIELGRQIRDVAIRTQADYVRRHISEGLYDRAGSPVEAEDRDPAVRYRRYLGLIKRRCMGNPFYIDISDGNLEIAIRNPANNELVLGRILGVYEALEGKPGDINWRALNGTLEIRVSPKP